MPRHGHIIAVLFALSSATMLTGCAQSPLKLDSIANPTTASTTPASPEAVAELARKWEANPADVNRGLAYASALESTGKTDKQLSVYDQLVKHNPGDMKLQGIYGRRLVAAGKPQQAVPYLERAAADGKPDWRVYSALGSAFDEQGLYVKARAQYDKALKSDPQNLVVLNNLGMSFALEGNLKQAETILRQADALPNSRSEPRIRQNLALVVGLQGRFDEARQLAREDLPPEQVEENMAYLQKMLSQPNTWQQISDAGKG